MANTTRTSTTSKKPRTPRAATRPAPEPDEDTYDDDTAAQAQELEATGRHVLAELCGEELRIIPPGAWRQSWQRLLNQGLVDDFAEIVIHPDDFEIYRELDPTNEEFGEFVASAAERGGESLGKSRGPATSPRRTRRR
ncbi:hypothetical protein [Streptomyces sp. C10-9-1]|uniref:hypothetical protein n=1 Tax=Streptomyces sp. C10-9-1 TaxID=1859285 RepID=UPI003F4A77E7